MKNNPSMSMHLLYVSFEISGRISQHGYVSIDIHASNQIDFKMMSKIYHKKHTEKSYLI